VAAVVACAAAVEGRADVVFTDVTARAGVTMTHTPKPAGVPGFNEWIVSGLCVGDFNRDGWPDLFVNKGGIGTDRLFINQGNGTFIDQAAAWGVAAVQCGAGATVGDYDRDGWPDIYVTSYGNANNNLGELGKHILYRNTGAGSFVNVALQAGVNQNSTVASSGNGAAWGDYDLDGDLDLAVTAWSSTANGNRLFRNDGNGSFTDVSGTAIVFPTVTWGFQSSFADLDGDGYPELLLSADFKTSRLYRNNRDGTFVDVTGEAGAGVELYGMGQCAGDFDRDGDLDWYVTSIHMEFPSNPNGKNGNTFYRNDGANLVEISHLNGTQDGGWGWGAVAGDFDQDGWLDIVEVNGRNAAEWANEPEYFYRNVGGSFVRDEAVSAMFNAGDGRTVVSLDFDRDGDLDLAIFYNQGPLKLYRNDSTRVGRWLQVDLSPGSNPRIAPFGYGARVVATVGGVELVRFVDGGNGYQGSSEPLVHFGVGSATVVDELRVEWPRGNVTILTDVPTHQRLAITAPVASDLNGDGQVGAADLAMLLSAWGAAPSIGRFVDLDDDGLVGPADLATLLSAWTP
jgi:hypothetical protein